MEKEARFVLNEIMAKMNQNEKLIGVGAIVAIVGFILGLFLATSSVAFVTINWYSGSGAEGTGFIAIAAAVVAVVLVYLKYAPNMNITWPAPFGLILLIVTVVGALAGLLGLFQAFTSGAGFGDTLGKPVTLYVVAGAVLVGCALQAYAAYMEWVAAGRPTAGK
jgi:hypothetical protein